MKTTAKNISVSSLFPADKERIFSLLKELSTLQYIACPYAIFTPVNENTELLWETGRTYKFAFKLFGIIPFGIHTIEMVEFSEEKQRVYTIESNKHVPVWNHLILLEEIDKQTTKYTDEVEVSAGWKTPFVCLWAKSFYRHRQKKWRKLLNDDI